MSLVVCQNQEHLSTLCKTTGNSLALCQHCGKYNLFIICGPFWDMFGDTLGVVWSSLGDFWGNLVKIIRFRSTTNVSGIVREYFSSNGGISLIIFCRFPTNKNTKNHIRFYINFPLISLYSPIQPYTAL